MNFFVDTWEKLYDWWIDGWLWIFENLLGALASLIESIPAPDWMMNLSGYTIPDSIAFFVELFQLPAGAAIMVSAWVLRFGIRRIPVIG